MRILITNGVLARGTGTETLVRDLAPALRRRGHQVVCYAPELGWMAAQIRATGTPVVDSAAALQEAPDIIHGHHAAPTLVALTRFAEVPAIFACHDWSALHDEPPLHPRIRRYLYVRHVLRERLVSEAGVPPERVRFWGNCVDLDRIGEARVPASVPRRAGIFARAGTLDHLPQLAEACRRHGIAFAGELLPPGHDIEHPTALLEGCDIAFASGRMAIEAMARGCAVINADRFGIGGMVTPAAFDPFRNANFAIGALSSPPTGAVLDAALAAYSASDAAAVTRRVRAECDVATGAERLETIYQEAMAESAPENPESERIALARLLERNLQQGLLYCRATARRRHVPDPDAELIALLDHLGQTSGELIRRTELLAAATRGVGEQTARVARLQPIGAAIESWRRLRARLRRR